MRKRTSFLAPRFTVPFSHGEESRTFKVLRISSAADGKQMSPSHPQCAFSDATAWKCGCELWNATPLGYLMLIWAVWELILKPFPLLSTGQPRAGDKPGTTMDYTGVNTARISHWLANKCFFLFWSWRGECPVSLAVLLEYEFLVSRGGMQWVL